jgi:hypothetical protein
MMKTTNLIKNTSMIGLALAMGMTSCKKDKDEVPAPAKPNENELITTVKLLSVDEYSEEAEILQEFTWRDLDGDGPKAPTQIDTVKLVSNSNYKFVLLLLDETKTPADTISEEVLEEGDEHQFFFKNTGGLDLEYSYEDADENGVPIGIAFSAQTKLAASGGLNIVLKHQPGVKPKEGKGDESKGSTDINITMPVKVSNPKLEVAVPIVKK